MSSKYCAHCMQPTNNNEAVCHSCKQPTTLTSPAHHLKCGTVLRSKYLVGRALGEGGFGITYIGRDLTLDMRIAIKEYYPHGCANRSNRFSNEVTMSQGNQGIDYLKDMDRFLSEARILARFSNEPGVVGVRDFFQENGTAYIVMEYLDGITLKNYIKKYGPIPADTFFPMIAPILQALGNIHQQGLIHRDISPDNIMMLKDGRLKLLDFGAAREVTGDKSLSVVLKKGYAPEEQYRSKGHQGPWTDVYAMCATIYKCITGITPEESIQRVFEDDLKTPSQLGVAINKTLEQALMMGLSVKSADRFQSMAALSKAFTTVRPENIKAVDIHRSGTGKTPSHEGKGPSKANQPEEDKTLSGAHAGTNQGNQAANEVDKTVLQTDKYRTQGASGATERRRSPGTKKPIVIAAGALVLAAIIIGIVFGTQSSKSSGDMSDRLPTERQMVTDCSTVLKQEGISGGILDLQVQQEHLNEKFQTFTVLCDVDVQENGSQSQYSVKLYYEYEDGSWILGNLCAIE